MQGGTRKRGATWSYYFDLGIVDGKRKRKEKGGFKTKGEAQKALREALKEFESCGSIIEESNISVSDYFDYWFTEYVTVNCKYNTQNIYRNVINNHIKPKLGSLKLKQLTPKLLQDFINSKYRNGFSKNSICNFYGVLSGALKYAVYPCQYLKENPITYVKMPKFDLPTNNSEDLKIITLENYNALLERFPFGSSFYVPMQIAFNTGLRASEVCALTWDNIDFENTTLTVNKILINKGNGIFEFGTPKTKNSNRTLAIGPTLIDILNKQKEYQNSNRIKYAEFYQNSNFICTKENGESVTTNSLKYLSRIVNYELGINFNFHSFRHTHATMLLENGANIKDIQLRLGHTRLATTMDIYSHLTDKIKTDTVNILEAALSKNKNLPPT